MTIVETLLANKWRKSGSYDSFNVDLVMATMSAAHGADHTFPKELWSFILMHFILLARTMCERIN